MLALGARLNQGAATERVSDGTNRDPGEADTVQAAHCPSVLEARLAARTSKPRILTYAISAKTQNTRSIQAMLCKLPITVW